jgi:procollagen-lysine,2-oxoglutarate 5-dioxygenase
MFFAQLSYDVIFLASLKKIVDKFKEWQDTRVLFSAEEFCWPDKSLASSYPEVKRGMRYLNSGGFIGYASDIIGILNTKSIEDTDDDQLFYTKIYLDPELRNKYKIQLDHKSEIFQNLNGAICKFSFNFYNIIFNTHCATHTTCDFVFCFSFFFFFVFSTKP